MQDIHDNLEPLSAPWMTLGDWVVLVLLFGVVAFGVLRYFLRSDDGEVEEVVEKKEEKPKEIFSFPVHYRKLTKLMKAEEWKEFCIVATLVLKKILEESYGESFDFATGKEVREVLRQKHISPQQRDLIEELFELLEPVKFAKGKGNIELCKDVRERLKKVEKAFL